MAAILTNEQIEALWMYRVYAEPEVREILWDIEPIASTIDENGVVQTTIWQVARRMVIMIGENPPTNSYYLTLLGPGDLQEKANRIRADQTMPQKKKEQLMAALRKTAMHRVNIRFGNEKPW